MLKISILFYKLDKFFLDIPQDHYKGLLLLAVLWTSIHVTLPAQQWHWLVFQLQLFPSETKPLIAGFNHYCWSSYCT